MLISNSLDLALVHFIQSAASLGSEVLARGGFRAFYLNVNSNRCEAFLYGGFNGNSNRFSDVARCRKTCGGKRAATYNNEEKKKFILSFFSSQALIALKYETFD